MIIPEPINKYLLTKGYGTSTDPMVISITSSMDAKMGFLEWSRENSINGRWVSIDISVLSGTDLSGNEIQDCFNFMTTYTLYYIPDTTQYILAKLRWSE